MIIRLEQPQDWREVENLTREAFWNVYRPGCQEPMTKEQYKEMMRGFFPLLKRWRK